MQPSIPVEHEVVGDSKLTAIGPANGWPEDGRLRISRRSPRCTVLGPGVRAVIWVQGCPLRCAGCIAPLELPFIGGSELSIDQLADELAALDVEGLTLSGGEPFAQASALTKLITLLRERRPDWGFLSYSGYTLDQLILKGTSAQLALLSQLDILVDGPYVQSRHTDLRWRGSDNQQVHFLTPKYYQWMNKSEERGTYLEFEAERGGFRVVGILPQGFMEQLRESMSGQGILLVDDESPESTVHQRSTR